MYNEKIIKIDTNFSNADFPERFANEIYISDLDRGLAYDYISPFSIKYCYQGIEGYEVGGRNLGLNPHQALIVNSKTEVTALPFRNSTSAGNDIGMSIFLDESLIQDVLSILDWPKKIPEYHSGTSVPYFFDQIIVGTSFNDYLGNIFQQFYRVGKTAIEQSFYYTICENLFQFQYNFFEKIERINKIKYSTRKEIFYRLSLAKDFIQSTYISKKFDLDAVARNCAMSKYFLIKCFKSVYHTTPQQYYQQLKIDKAKELLKTGDSITHIAFLLGYPDIYSFSKQFRNRTNISPLQYRQYVLR